MAFWHNEISALPPIILFSTHLMTDVYKAHFMFFLRVSLCDRGNPGCMKGLIHLEPEGLNESRQHGLLGIHLLHSFDGYCERDGIPLAVYGLSPGSTDGR